MSAKAKIKTKVANSMCYRICRVTLNVEQLYDLTLNAFLFDVNHMFRS